jgi:hypothetical protein
MVAPIRAEDGDSVIVGPVTVKVVTTVRGLTTPLPLPVTVIKYGPGALLLTTKLAVKAGLVPITHVPWLTGEPEMEQLVYGWACVGRLPVT